MKYKTFGDSFHYFFYTLRKVRLTLDFWLFVYSSKSLVNACRCCYNFQVYHRISLSHPSHHTLLKRIRYWCLNMKSPSIYMLKACLYACIGLRSQLNCWPRKLHALLRTSSSDFCKYQFSATLCLKSLPLTHLYLKDKSFVSIKKGALLTTESQFVFRRVKFHT